MKKKLLLALIFAIAPVVAHGAFNSQQLAPSPNSGNCLNTDGFNNLWGSCGSGGGGGGAGTFSTTSIAGRQVQYPTVGNTVTSLDTSGTTTSKWWFDPISALQKITGSIWVTASSTFGSIFTNTATTTQLAVTGISNNSIVKTNSLGQIVPAISGTDYQAPGTYVLNIGPVGQLQSNATITFASSTTGSDFSITGAANTITFNLPTASAVNRGLLSSTDWSTFNGKQAAGNYITALTGDGTASGPGSVAFTLATVNGNIGSFGGTNSIPTFTVNGKGLLTAAGAITPSIPASEITSGTFGSGNYIFPAQLQVNSSTTLQNFTALNSTTTNATSTSFAITSLARPSGTVLAVDQNGSVIATTTGSGGSTSPGGSAGQLQYNASGSFGGVATTSVSCSGTVSCTPFSVIGASPITLVGSASGGSSGTWSTTTSNVPGELNNFSNNNTDIVDVGSNSTTTAFTYIDPNQKLLYVKGSIGTTSQPIPFINVSDLKTSQISNLTSNGAILTNLGVGLLSTFTGSGCSNQFVRSLSANINTTCATVGPGDVSLATLTAGDTSLTFSGSYNGSTNRTAILNTANGNVWTASTTIGNNTTAGGLTVNGGATTTGTAYFAGRLGIGTTSPYSQLSINSNSTSDTVPSLIVDGVSGGNNADINLNRGSNTGTEEANIDFSTAGAINYQLGIQNNGTNNFELWDGSNNPIITANNATGDVGIGTTSPYAELSVWGDSVPSDTAFNVVSVASSTMFNVLNNGNVGIGTTSPYAKLSVDGRGVFNQDVRANFFTATSTTLASTFPYASTTVMSASYASSTLYYGAGLANCGISQALLWLNGIYSCSTLQPSGMAGSIHTGQVLTTSSSVAGWGSVDLSNSNFAVSNTLAYSNGGTGTSTPAKLGDLLEWNGTNWQGFATSTLGISGGGGSYPFNVATNATTTLVAFNGGLTSYASTTIGAGAQATGLTVNGGATTTGSVQIGLGATQSFNVNTSGLVGVGTSTQDSTLDVAGSVRFEGLSATTSPSISGAIIGLGCDSGDLTGFTGLASTTVFLTTPQSYPGDGLTWFSYALNSTTIRTKVCSDVTVTPGASTYNIRIIK